MDDRQYFDVDPSEKDEFTAAAGGRGRWDPTTKRWSMATDDLRRAPNKSELARWRPPHVSWRPDEAGTTITVHGVPHRCIRCKQTSVAVVGLTIDGDEANEGVVFDATAGPALKLVADALSGISQESINRHDELTHFRRRWSNTRAEVCFANCCGRAGCEFLFGEFYLHQELVEADEAQSLIELARVQVPRHLLDEVIGDYEDD